mgnify:CR=1 FL=1|jgi:hypothetical protein
MTTLTLTQEYKNLTKLSTPAVMRAVFNNLNGYKVARQNDSYEDYVRAMNGMGSRK